MTQHPRCTIEGCGNKQTAARKMCGTHYKRFLKHGDPLYVWQPERTRCEAPECDRFATDCYKHRYRFRRYGTYELPDDPREQFLEDLDHASSECVPWPFSVNVYGTPVHRHKHALADMLASRNRPDLGCKLERTCDTPACVAPAHNKWGYEISGLSPEEIARLDALVPFPLGAKFWMKVDVREPDECWEWVAGRSPDGYGRINMFGSVNLTSRLVVGLKSKDAGLACHHCDNPPCVNPLHLYVGDYKTNGRDAVERHRFHGKTGLSAGKPRRGEETARHSDSDVIFSIRWLAASGHSNKSIARRMGKSDHGWVSRVVRGLRWEYGPWPSIDDPDDAARAMRLGFITQQTLKDAGLSMKETAA